MNIPIVDHEGCGSEAPTLKSQPELAGSPDTSAGGPPAATRTQRSDAEDIAASHEAPERFSAIFDRHYPAIRDYLRSRVAAAIADELASETFVVAFRQRSRYASDHADARPWLYGIATNLLRRARRQESRELRAYGRFAAEMTEGQSGHAIDRAVEVRLARAIRSLSRRDRDVLFLFACAELSYEEIARALDIPVGTVRSRLARARGKLRELLDAGEAATGQ